MRALTVAVLVLAFAAPAGAAPFGKPRTLGTTSSAYDYDSISSAPGPRGGVAFFVAGEKQTGLKIAQRLFIARVEGNGRTHRLTGTPVKTGLPARSYDGGPPFAYLAVGPHWRMLTTELRASRVYGIADVYAARLAPNGRRVAEQRIGPSNKASGIVETNARGDAVAAFGDGFTIACAAGRFVRAPKALKRHESLPVLAADGSLYDIRRPADSSIVIARSTGKRWGEPQRIAAPAGKADVHYVGLTSSSGGDALVVYGFAMGTDTSLLARWSHRGGRFGPPVQLASHANAYTETVEAIPGAGFAVRWSGGDGRLHLIRVRRRDRPADGAVSWPIPASAEFRKLLPLANGRTVVAWSIYDPEHVKSDRLKAAWIDAHGAVGRARTVATSRNLDGFALSRIGANRAALVWTQDGKGKKTVRIALAGG